MDIKKKDILEQAHKLFMRNGIKAITMDDIASHLRISKKTLYEHFTDKNDVVEHMVAFVTKQNTSCIDGICKHGLNAIDEQYEIASFVANMVSQMHPSIHFDIEKYHPKAWQILNEVKRSHVFDCLMKNMNKGIKEGFYRDDIHPEVIARIYMSRFDVMFDGDLFPANKFAFADIVWESFAYHVHGIASTKGVQYLQKKLKKERAA
jgi:TetR/AcrR family transcriptional regulator, cholesterol catabolism regulator